MKKKVKIEKEKPVEKPKQPVKVKAINYHVGHPK